MEAIVEHLMKEYGLYGVVCGLIVWLVRYGLPGLAASYREDVRTLMAENRKDREDSRAEHAKTRMEFSTDLKTITEMHRTAIEKLVDQIGILGNNVAQLSDDVAILKDRGPNRNHNLPQA